MSKLPSTHINARNCGAFGYRNKPRQYPFAVALILATGLILPSLSYAGCNISVGVKNTGNATFTVDWDESKVKVRGGTWKKLARNSQETVAPNRTKTLNYTASFNCGAKRRYQIRHVRGGSAATEYFPSPSGFTTRQSFTVNIDG